VVGWLLLTDRRLLPGLLLLPAGLLDIFDGGLARLRGEESRFGAFLDSVMDRISDAIVFGCLFWSLSEQHLDLQAALCMSALAISLLVSHVRAEAEALGLQLSEGLMQRLERYVALMVGLTAPGALLPVLAILTGFGAVTVAQRGWSAWRQLTQPAGTPGTGTSSVLPP
jgi:CDP-diacylglycerol--glycerol-3-phosphate 3-phosphatidyltransferase